MPQFLSKIYAKYNFLLDQFCFIPRTVETLGFITLRCINQKQEKKMTMKLFLVFLFLFCLTHQEDAKPLIGQNVCPVSSRRIFPDISNAPFLVGSDAVDDSGNQEEKLIVVPISLSMFMKLELSLLPTREVCVLGQKLKNLRVPYPSEFEIMTGIAIWFSPCVSKPTNVERLQCFEKKMKSIEAVNINRFKSLHHFLVSALKEM